MFQGAEENDVPGQSRGRQTATDTIETNWCNKEKQMTKRCQKDQQTQHGPQDRTDTCGVNRKRLSKKDRKTDGTEDKRIK